MSIDKILKSFNFNKKQFLKDLSFCPTHANILKHQETVTHIKMLLEENNSYKQEKIDKCKLMLEKMYSELSNIQSKNAIKDDNDANIIYVYYEVICSILDECPLANIGAYKFEDINTYIYAKILCSINIFDTITTIINL